MAKSNSRRIVKVSVTKRRHFYVQKRIAILIFVAFFGLLLALCVVSLANGESAIPGATSKFYVNDYAEVLSDDQEQEMLERAVSLSQKPEGVQVVVSTIKTLNGLSIEDYANKMYNQYGIGRDDKGALILLSTGDRKIRIEVGYGLESYLTDSKAGKFIDNYAISFLKNNEFDQGLISLQKAIVEDLDGHFESEKNQVPVKSLATTSATEETIQDEAQIDSTQNNENNYNRFMTIFALVFAIIGAFGFVIQSVRLNKSEKNRDYESEQYEKKTQAKQDRICSLEMNNSKLQKELEFESQKKCDYDRENQTLKRKCENLEKDVTGLRERLKNSEDTCEKYFNENSEFEHRHSVALKLYPDLDKDVSAKIKSDKEKKQREMAEHFNIRLQDTIKLPGYEAHLPRFEELSNTYNGFEEYTKSYVDQNMFQTLLGLLEEANIAKKERLLRLEAEQKRKAEEERKKKEAEEKERRKKEEEERKREAERRKKEEEERRKKREREEEEERRRRRLREEQRRMHSYNSFHSTSHHSGFGGHSGGGGASRGF